MLFKLVLHFDINGTITAVDSTEIGNDYENANMTIARSVLGKVMSGRWVHTGVADTISYYDYLKEIGENNYKKISFTFTEKGQPGEQFAGLMPQVLKSVSKDFVFRSFERVLESYPDAVVVLRSFGKDIRMTLETLDKNPKFSGSYTGFMCHNDDELEITFPDKKCTGISELNQYFHSSSKHLAIQEDYKYWNDHKRDAKHGKTILGDERLVQIFFDDNECVHIVGDKGCHFVKVNTLDALLDENYFTDHISKVLENYK